MPDPPSQLDTITGITQDMPDTNKHLAECAGSALAALRASSTHRRDRYPRHAPYLPGPVGVRAAAEGRYERALSAGRFMLRLTRVSGSRWTGPQQHLIVLRSIGALANIFNHSLCVGAISEFVDLFSHSLRIGTIAEFVDLFDHSLRIRTASKSAPFVDKPSKHRITFPDGKVIGVGGFLTPGFLPWCPQNSESPTLGRRG